jgi:L-fuconolactonase
MPAALSTTHVTVINSNDQPEFGRSVLNRIGNGKSIYSRRVRSRRRLDRADWGLSVLIDAHHHLWKHNDRDYDWMNSDALRALRRDFLVDDLVAATQSFHVHHTIVVQACQSVVETNWLLDEAAQNPLVSGVVGWVPLCSPDLTPILEQLAAAPKMKGVRHVLQDEPDEFFMLRDDFNRGVASLKDFGMVYDILIFERHLAQTIDFVDRHPQQVFVLDHIAKPRIREGVLSPWDGRIRELAKRENVYCKVSGMVTEADLCGWNVQQLQPYFDVVLAEFGPTRLMFGSDWPVLTLAGGYSAWVDAFRVFIAELSLDERERISSGTARDVYGI